MQLTDLSLDGFGVLADCRIEDLTPGLNVVHGPNGSGKTTLLHFLRGMWCGFDDARRRRLLPPLGGGSPGGSIDVAQGERRYRITRQALPNQYDRLTVAVRRGGLDDDGIVRGTLEALAPDLIHLLYAVSASEAHALDRLLQRAAADGVPLLSQRQRSTRFDERLIDVRDRRTSLLGGPSLTGETERLRVACQESAAELQSLQADADQHRERLTLRYDEINAELRRIEDRVAWLDAEMQGLQSNLIETEDRSVASVPVPAARSVVVECRPQDDLRERIRDVDARIVHARAVLADLAGSRMHVSVQSAQIAGTDEHDPLDAVRQQRALLRQLEQQSLHLRDATTALAQLRQQSCVCGQYEAMIAQSSRLLRQQIYLLCRQISRQEQAQRQLQLRTERSHLDRCEAELLEHVARLQRERNQLHMESPQPELSTLRHASTIEAQTCECAEHHHFADRATAKVRVQVAPVIEEPIYAVDPRRPAWRQRLAELTAELDRSKTSWRETLALRGEWDVERSKLIILERRMAEAEIEVTRRERMLAAKLDEGQSLLLVEAGLDRLRDHVFEDVPAQVIAEASEYLRELTAGRYPTLQVTGDGLDLYAVNDSGIPIPAGALSRGMLDQVGLSLRIALSDEYARRGVTLPLVLDEVLSDTDPERADIAVRLLQRVAERRQVLFLTCQEHLAQRFEAAGVSVRDFPGTHRSRVRIAVPAAAAQVTPPLCLSATVPSTPAATTTVTLADPVPAAVHAGEPHWLRVSSPVSLIPSLGEQLARRLSTAGIQTIGDLVDSDPEDADLPLDALQITPAQWRIWQAEGRLLCCVPQLTGRDAQVLAAVGMLVPQELAESDADALVRKIDRLRGDGRSGWVTPGFVWPDRNIVAGWIANARRSRTFREACDSIGWTSSRRRGPAGGRRNFRVGSRHFRVDQPTGPRGPRQRRRLGHRVRSRATSGRREFVDETRTAHGESRGEFERRDRTPAAQQFTATPDASTPQRLRFHLELQNPIVDAPSIGPTTARRFEKIGVLSVGDLVSRDAQQLVERLQHRRITTDMVRQWQDQSRLMCRVPELRAHDAQVLVACGLTDPDAVARLSPQALFNIVGPFVATKEGQRLLRSAKCPDLAEVTDWISWSQQSRVLKAA